jgi:formylglycine-generating enzyme required for sulfatase activity
MSMGRAVLVLLLQALVLAQPRDDHRAQELERKVRAAEAAVESAREELRQAYRRVEACVAAAFADGGSAWRAEFLRAAAPLLQELRRDLERPGAAARQRVLAQWSATVKAIHENLVTPGLQPIAGCVAARLLALGEDEARLVAALKEPDEVLAARILDPLLAGEMSFARRWNEHLATDQAAAVGFREKNRLLEEARLEVAILRDPILAFQAGAPQGFARVPAGSYLVRTTSGAPNLPGRKRERTTTIREVFVSIHEVTCGQYWEWLRTLPKEEIPRREPKDDRGAPLWPADPSSGVPTPPADSMPLPVVGVTFENALLFARARKARLPTEDEWCAMAGGRDGRLYPWGSEYEKGRANDLQAALHAVTAPGSFPQGRGPFGHHDVAGNVREWVMTYENGKPVAADRLEPANVLVRGGSFASSKEDVSNGYVWIKQAFFDQDLQTGFRLARDP